MENHRIISRPYGLFSVMAGLIGLFFLVMPLLSAMRNGDDPSRRLDPFFAALIMLTFGVPGIWAFVYCRFARIIADSSGLQWRTGWRFWQWQTAPWDAVRDFHDNQVDLSDGRSISLLSEGTNRVRLRDFIARHATRAKDARLPDGTIGWAAKGIRPTELPVVCEYKRDQLEKKRRNNRWRLLSVAMLIMAMATGLTFLPTAESADSCHCANPGDPMNQLWARVSMCGVLAVCGPLLFVPLWVISDRDYRAAQARADQGERCVIGRDGMTFTRDGENRFVPWSEVVGWEFGIGYNRNKNVTSARIRTASGQEFTLSSLIENYDLLQAALPLYAPDGIEYKLAQNASNALGGVASRWTGGEEGKGDRVFHARTKPTGGGILALYGFFGWMAWFPVVTLWQYGSLFGPEWAIFVIYFSMLLPLIAATIWYFRARVQVGKEGVSVIGLGCPWSLTWSEIERIHTEGALILEGRDGSILEIAPVRYAHGSELPALITETWERTRRANER